MSMSPNEFIEKAELFPVFEPIHCKTARTGFNRRGPRQTPKKVRPPEHRPIDNLMDRIEGRERSLSKRKISEMRFGALALGNPDYDELIGCFIEDITLQKLQETAEYKNNQV